MYNRRTSPEHKSGGSENNKRFEKLSHTLFHRKSLYILNGLWLMNIAMTGEVRAGPVVQHMILLNQIQNNKYYPWNHVLQHIFLPVISPEFLRSLFSESFRLRWKSEKIFSVTS
jgi:hypothetical protein